MYNVISNKRNEESSISEAEHGMKLIADTGDNKFPHLCLYNSLASTGSTAEGIEGLLTIYSNLLGLHGFMAGFQYISLEDGEISTYDDAPNWVKTMKLISFSCRLLGFLVSLLGTLICVITQEYLKTVQHEPIETQVQGILRYAYFFQFADYTAILAAVLLAVACNTLIWNETVPVYLALATAIVTTVGCFTLFFVFYMIIVRKQKSRMIYDDPNYIAARKKL